MTVGEVKEKILQLLDEYGNGDEELEERMPGLLDLAQKRLAGIQKTVKAVTLDCAEEEFTLPEDALGFYRLWVNGRICRSPQWVGGKLRLRAGAKSAVIEYFALPAAIREDSSDTMELELSESACACIPFLVAGELLSADMVQDGSTLLGIYAQMVSELDTALPTEGKVYNSYYGGRG